MQRALRRVQHLGCSLRSLSATTGSETSSSACQLLQSAGGISAVTGQRTALAASAGTWQMGVWAAQNQLRAFTPSILSWAPMEVQVPQMGESVSEGTICAILKKPGDVVREDDIIAQIETDKVTIDIKYTSKESGIITALQIKDQDVVQPGMAVCTVDVGGAGSADAAAPPAPAADAPAPAAKAAAPAAKAAAPAAKAAAPAARAAPAAAKAAAPAAKAAAPAAATPAPAKPQPAAPGEPTSTGPKPERRVKMTRLRLRVAERLKGAQNTYAMLTTFNEVDMTSLMEMRNAYKDMFLEKHGCKLGFMSAFIKASAYALAEVPAVNGVIDGDEIVYRDYVDISIAVATPKGLVVPVLRNAGSLSFANIEKELAALGKKARDGTISIDDMAGGTFTVSNGGVYGSLLSTPIINPPQSAILGMHAINQRAMVMQPGNKIEARPIMNLALTYDHRLIDGREAVMFLKRIKEVVEDPRRLLIDC